MAENFNGKYFIASRGFYGTNSVSYKNIELEVTQYNNDYANPITSFDWGNSDRGTKLLAFAMLNIIASPTIARVYANKYTQNVLQNLKKDEWKMEATEVVQWVNENTEYKIKIDDNNEKKIELALDEEALAKEKRKREREEEFKRQVEEKLKKRNETNSTNNIVDNLCNELHIKHETLAKILDVSVEIINNWRLENEMPKLAIKAIEFYKAGILFKEKNLKLKAESQEFKEKLTKMQADIDLNEADLKKYRKIINSLDIPNLCKMYKEL